MFCTKYSTFSVPPSLWWVACRLLKIWNRFRDQPTWSPHVLIEYRLASNALLAFLQQINQALFRILFDQIEHSLDYLVSASEPVTSITYFRHNRISFFILDIPERHLSSLMLVESKFRLIDITDLWQWNCKVLTSIEQQDSIFLIYPGPVLSS